jgi:superfamily II DNA or RNA helicase
MWDNATWTPRRWQEEALPLAISALKEGKRPIISAIMGAGKSILIAELVYQGLKKLRPDMKIVVVAPRQALIRQLSKTISVRCGEDQVGMYYADQKDTNKNVIVTTFVSAPTIARMTKVSMLVGDEVHGTEAEHFKSCYDTLDPACAIGFTATPYRANEKESLSLWDEVVYRYSAADALSDRVIVPWELVHWDGTGSSDTDDVCHRLIAKQAGPGVVSALNIDDAESYAGYLNRYGIRASAIHSKMGRKQREHLLAMLEKGSLKCLVHVSLLAEGVDMPWLQWLCLRRPVGSRVRFVQEVGRVLRAHPGKELAYILDPHDLFGMHCLSNPERLGEVLTREEREYEEELVKLAPEEDDRENIRKMPPAKAFMQMDSYITNLLSVMRGAGVCSPPKKWVDDHWRGGIPTRKQLCTVEKCRWSARYLPEDIRVSFKLILDRAHTYNKGTCTDLLEILFGLAKASKQARARRSHYFLPNIRWPKPKFAIQQLLFVMEKN